jgi:nucleotide-binding universal stress UspA family protein
MVHRSERDPHIVVGVDGSLASLYALRWAWRQAQSTSAALTVVIAWQQPTLYADGVWAGVGIPFTDWQEAARSQLEAAIRDTLGEDGFGSVARQVIRGHPAAALMKVARDADLLVVGAHGHGAIRAALLGSVSLHLAHHAPCPLTIIPSPRGPQTLNARAGRIAVAVDASTSSCSALRWASRQSDATSARLEAVLVCGQSTPTGSDSSPHMRGSADLELHHAVVDALGYQAARNVTETLLEGDAVPTLFAAATGGDMLVVGSGGHGALAGMLFGAVSTRLWEHPPCPLTIIPLPSARRPSTARVSWHRHHREPSWNHRSGVDGLGFDGSR